MFFSLWLPISSGVSLWCWACLFWPLPILTSPCRMGTPDFLPRSIDVKLGDFPEGVSSLDIVRSLLEFFQKNADFKVVAVQQCPNKIARVTFEEGGEAAKADFVDEESIFIRGVKCQVIRPALPGDRVLVYHYPYENDDSQVERALSQFGLVKDVSYQSWVGLKGVHTGTRMVRMDRTTRIPRSIMIDGFRCKIWYRGQPVTCDVCREEGHVAAKCSRKGTCFNCRQPGHMARDCPDRSYRRGAWGQPSKGVSWVPEPDGSAGGGSPVVEAHRTESVSVVGAGPSGQALSSPAPPSSGGGVSSDGGVSPVSVPDSELSLSVCGDGSAASTVLNSQGYIVSNGDNAIKNANDIDNASSKVSNSNVSCGNASSNVSDSAICTASSASNAINVNKLDNVASNEKTSADNGPKSCSSADLNSNVLGEPVSDASVEVSPSSSVDTEMVPASNHRKRSAPKPPLEDSAAPPGFTSGSSSSEPGKSKISKKAPGPPGCHSLPASVSLAARTASTRGPLS